MLSLGYFIKNVTLVIFAGVPLPYFSGGRIKVTHPLLLICVGVEAKRCKFINLAAQEGGGAKSHMWIEPFFVVNL